MKLLKWWIVIQQCYNCLCISVLWYNISWCSLYFARLYIWENCFTVNQISFMHLNAQVIINLRCSEWDYVFCIIYICKIALSFYNNIMYAASLFITHFFMHHNAQRIINKKCIEWDHAFCNNYIDKILLSFYNIMYGSCLFITSQGRTLSPILIAYEQLPRSCNANSLVVSRGHFGGFYSRSFCPIILLKWQLSLKS